MTAIKVFVVACGALAILYAIWTSRSVLSADPGNKKMQEISAAVQEGARAYLNRQYMTISGVGLVLFVVISVLLGIWVGVGYLIGAVLSGAAGYIGIALTPPSAAAPTIIMTLAVADSIHILVTMFHEMRHGAAKRAAVIESLIEDNRPALKMEGEVANESRVR